MKLLHMYKCSANWLETPSMHPNYVYVYWYGTYTFEEHQKIGDVTTCPKVSIDTNPFN